MNGNSAHTPLVELINKQKFTWVNIDITDGRFPTPGRLWKHYKEFYFGENIRSEEIVERMRAEGYEPANSHELLLWDGWNREDDVIALGSVTEVGGYDYVPCFNRCATGQFFTLRWWTSDWGVDYRFLAVRKSPDA